MFDPQMELLLTALRAVIASESDGSRAERWAEASAALETCAEIEEDVLTAVRTQDVEALESILTAWLSGQRHLLVHDRDVLKRALKAYRKRLKVTRLDAETTLGGGPMSSGRKSTILGITPPDRYPRAVWDELVRQGRLLDAKQGMYELPPD